VNYGTILIIEGIYDQLSKGIDLAKELKAIYKGVNNHNLFSQFSLEISRLEKFYIRSHC
jgi:hypothetical protein